jgi:hypothetical protein
MQSKPDIMTVVIAIFILGTALTATVHAFSGF